jgi:hypothetical protein
VREHLKNAFGLLGLPCLQKFTAALRLMTYGSSADSLDENLRMGAVRKDVEWTFGVLQARFRIIHSPCKLWNAESMKKNMIAAIILHNMIFEDGRVDPNQDYLFEDGFVPFNIVRGA